MLTGFMLGLGVGVLVTAYAAVLMIRRHLRRVRAAERRARAAERLAEIGSMTSGLAHEIKNPLSTIGLNAQLLVEGISELPVTPEDRASLINRTRALRRETERLAGILQDFLQFAGQIVLDRRYADLNTVIEELVDFYSPEAERQGVRLRAEKAPAPLVANVDVKLIKQALLNLVLNATQAMARDAKASGTEGRVRELVLRTEFFRDPENALANAARIRVIDDGPGMNEETKRKLFTPYFTTRPGGSGLGLPTTRRLIHEHGGRIQVESEVGKGSDFIVVLPLDDSKDDRTREDRSGG